VMVLEVIAETSKKHRVNLITSAQCTVSPSRSYI
jgi:hypothetical protein